MPPRRGLGMFAPVTYVRWRGRILYVLSFLIGMSSITPLGMSDKEEGREAVLRPLALPSLRSPLFPCLRSPFRAEYGIIRSKGSSDRGAYTEDRSMKSLEVEDQVVEGHALKIEASVL